MSSNENQRLYTIAEVTRIVDLNFDISMYKKTVQFYAQELYRRKLIYPLDRIQRSVQKIRAENEKLQWEGLEDRITELEQSMEEYISKLPQQRERSFNSDLDQSIKEKLIPFPNQVTEYQKPLDLTHLAKIIPLRGPK